MLDKPAMFDLALTSQPDRYDEYGQPCFSVEQKKGLFEFQTKRLMSRAKAEGYSAAVARTLIASVTREIARAATHTRPDVVEIGGGTGAFFQSVRNDVGTYINIEPGHLALLGDSLTILRDPRYTCIKCSAEEIPLPDASADIVLSLASLDHVPDCRKALAEVRRLLRDGGTFILTINNRRSWWKTMLSGTAYLRARERAIAREHYVQWSFSECVSHVAEFIPLRHIYTTTFFPFVPCVWRLLLPAFDLIGRRLIPSYGGNIVAVYRKPRLEPRSS